MTRILAAIAVWTFAALPATQAQSADPLESWNDGAAKSSIVKFVERVTSEGSKDFVPARERIAVFDNDGTLWCEYPVPNQVAFAFDEIKRLLPEHPEWKSDPAVAAMLEGDVSALVADDHRGLIRILTLTHAGMTVEAFAQSVDRWLATAQHPRFNVPYDQTIYQPMLEVLDYLRANGFETWIVSGGGQDFMRVFSEKTYGIPPQQIIGSHGKLKYELVDGKPTLTKTLETLFIDDKEGKPVGIAQFIGRRPIACFGNSNGDQAMMEYTTIDNPRPNFGLIVHHTDADREYAYDANPTSSGKLTTALEVAPERGWTVVDMKRDWKQVFAPKSSDQTATLVGGEWMAVEIGGRDVLERTRSTVRFTEDGSVSGNTAVNRFSGKATLDGDKLSFGPMATTRRAGPPAWMDQEQRYLKALGSVAQYEFTDPSTVLFQDKNGKTLLKLSKK